MPNGRGDEGASLPATNPRIESVDEFILQAYVQTHGHSLAHSHSSLRPEGLGRGRCGAASQLVGKSTD
jgi:hypothetical protein